MKILVMGHGEHGKDTVCEMLGLPFTSSSMIAAEHIIFPLMSGIYDNAIDCYNDRRNNRDLWAKLISTYNTPDRTKLARLIFDKCDVYCGLRKAEELYAINSAKMVDKVVWVDASERLPSEPSSSITVIKEMADVMVDNNGSLDDLRVEVDKLKRTLGFIPVNDETKPLKDIIVEWADEVFPDRTITNALTKMVMHEIPEYLAKQDDAMELADIGILLYDIAHLAGVDLELAIRRKMEINKFRVWEKDEQGLMSHVKDMFEDELIRDESGK